MASNVTKGRDAEVRVQKMYEEAGWDVERKRNTSVRLGSGFKSTTGDFFGLFDLVCLCKTWRAPHLVQVTIEESLASKHRIAIKQWMGGESRGITALVFFWQRHGPNANHWILYRYRSSPHDNWNRVAYTRAEVVRMLTSRLRGSTTPRLVPGAPEVAAPFELQEALF